MSAPPQSQGAPITDRAQLAAALERGCKPADAFRIGTEHEKLIFERASRRRAPFEGPSGIGAILQGFADRYGWTPMVEDGRTVALTKDGCNITLEPGGQFELSGAPLRTVHETCSEANRHLEETKAILGSLGAGALGVGFDPQWSRDEAPLMPKGRYGIMKRYMPTRGSLGLDMMLRTCTIQVNLDFSSEQDMVKKFRVSLALQPIATALFANSPFTEGKPNGFKSYRSHIWTDTDPDRTGDLPFVFEDGFGFERYVDWVLDAPMYFLFRDGEYKDVAGQSFRAFLDGKLKAAPGETPFESDWSDHLTTVFPEVRLKKFLEMRGADGGPWGEICALPAFWVGLLYDGSALDAAWDLVKDWSAEERAQLRADAPKHALEAPFRQEKLYDVAKRAVAIARQGLEARAKRDWAGVGETTFLKPLEETLALRATPADRKLALFEGAWGGSVEPIWREFAY